jgi:hypothetical protein
MRTSAKRVKCVTAGLWLCAGMASFVHAQDIHKCITGNSVTYQAAPCGDRQMELAVLSVPAGKGASVGDAGIERGRSELPSLPAGDGTAAIAMRNPIVRPPRWIPFARNGIAPGMSDDEVLNTAGAGMPARISRSRDARTWREVWFYLLRDGTVRQLSFTNGKLTDIESGRPATPPIRITDNLLQNPAGPS